MNWKIILNKEKIRSSSALFGIIKSSTEHYIPWRRDHEKYKTGSKKKTVPLISFAFPIS